LNDVLKECEEVFEETKQLPPNREIDYKILIKVGVDPINVRPYRYPHLLKTEIEKQVEEMMKEGIIKPSNNPYSSTMILVKKDYRALNKATILNKFPIPIIEELLDELYVAHYFSKVDLRAGYHHIRMHEFEVASSCTSIPSCATPIIFSYSKNILSNIPDYIIRKSFFRFRISFRIM